LVTDIPHEWNGGGWATVNPSALDAMESTRASVEAAYLASGLESPAGTLLDLDAGTWPGELSLDPQTDSNTNDEVWTAVSRGAHPWLLALGLTDSEHGWPARQSVSSAAWLATS